MLLYFYDIFMRRSIIKTLQLFRNNDEEYYYYNHMLL